jgi:cobalt/nickel transport system permease protein
MSLVPQPVCVEHCRGGISGIDPRVRIVAAIVFSLATAEVRSFTALFLALAAAASAGFFSGLSLKRIIKRLLPLNALMLMLAVLLPLSVPGKTAAAIGPFCFSQQGLLLAAEIAIKGNAIMLAVLMLIGTMDVNTLGHALDHLRAPRVLTHLFLFTVRYLDIFVREYLRLRCAMKVRGFRPRMDLCTYRGFGNLLGMLLVRSYDRSERIQAAMKCRGFQGRFHLLDHFRFRAGDLFFCILSSAILITILVAQFLWPNL